MTALPKSLTNQEMIDLFSEKVISAADLDPIAAATDEDIAQWINQALYEIGAVIQQRSFSKSFQITAAETDLSQHNIFQIHTLWLDNGHLVEKYDLRRAENTIWNNTSSATITSWFQNGNVLCVNPIPIAPVNVIADAVVLPDGISSLTPTAVTSLAPLLHRSAISLAVARACEQTATEPHQVRAIEKMIADAYGMAKLMQRQNMGQQMPRAVTNWSRKTIS